MHHLGDCACAVACGGSYSYRPQLLHGTVKKLEALEQWYYEWRKRTAGAALPELMSPAALHPPTKRPWTTVNPCHIKALNDTNLDPMQTFWSSDWNEPVTVLSGAHARPAEA